MIFPSEQLRERHRAWGLEVPARSVVVPHGWRLGATRRAAAARRPARVVFLFLGKLLPTKGVDLLLEAWGDGIAGAELWIAGAGPLEPAVGGRRTVRSLGWLDAPARDAALAAAVGRWCCRRPVPRSSCSPRPRARSPGLPVISTTVAAPPAVRDGESGILVDAGRRRAARRHVAPARPRRARAPRRAAPARFAARARLRPAPRARARDLRAPALARRRRDDRHAPLPGHRHEPAGPPAARHPPARARQARVPGAQAARRRVPALGASGRGRSSSRTARSGWSCTATPASARA